MSPPAPPEARPDAIVMDPDAPTAVVPVLSSMSPLTPPDSELADEMVTSPVDPLTLDPEMTVMDPPV
jgi:hypothetical protein